MAAASSNVSRSDSSGVGRRQLEQVVLQAEEAGLGPALQPGLERVAGAVQRVVEVLRSGAGTELRPQAALDLLAVEAVVGCEGEQLDEPADLTAPPRRVLHGPPVDPRREAAEQPQSQSRRLRRLHRSGGQRVARHPRRSPPRDSRRHPMFSTAQAEIQAVRCARTGR